MFPGTDSGLFGFSVSVLVVLGLLFSGSPSGADLGVLGDRFETEGLTFCELSDGNFAITWVDQVIDAEVWLRVYGPDGTPVTGPILVYSDQNPASIVGPKICCKPQGGLAVVYGVASTIFGMNSLEVRGYDNSGLPLAAAAEVTGVSPFNVPEAPACYEGGFLANWSRDVDLPFEPTHYLVRRFGADGLPTGPEFRVDEGRSSFEPALRVAARADGSFIAAWAGPVEGTITAQEYDSSDVEVGPEMSVLDLGSSETFQDLDLAINAAGERMFVWTENTFPDTYGRGFDDSGLPLSTPFEVDGAPGLQAKASDVVARPNGDFIVTWAALVTDVISVDTITPEGLPFGSPLVIEPEGSFRYGTRLIPPRGSRFAASFLGADPMGGQKVPYIRLLSAGPPFFSDGFETGDTSAWSTTVP